jgi:hypothetical protein
LSGLALEQVRAEQESAWRTRLSDLLEERPDAEDELRALVAEVQALVIGSVGRVEQHTTASGHARQAVQGQGVQINDFGSEHGPGVRGGNLRAPRAGYSSQRPRIMQGSSASGQSQQAVQGYGVQVNNFSAPVPEVSAVPLAMAIRDPRPVFAAVHVAMFSGRTWLLNEIDQFIAASPCGYVFVEAEAGLGKTALAARLAQARGYLSHFSRYSDGRSVRAALQNLSAQLVRSFGLTDFAPGGMLPDWVPTPIGFEAVLGQAADQARERKKRLILVVDGLDEAESSRDTLPFGLPTLLPDGVYVIGTHRPGRSPGQPDAPTLTVRITKDDQRNVADVREFLESAAGEETLAARLAEASMDPAEFVSVLAEHCDGVWVYLRYVLEELRLGLRRPGAIADLPSGLGGYYAAQIRRWHDDPEWDACLLPLLATLGVAGEPLSAEVLARLGGELSIATVRRLCDITYRPLLTVTRGTRTGAPPRYEIYHASVRELLKGHGDNPQQASGGLSYELEALVDELRQATRAAHSRVASTYLDGFGSLAAGLPTLAAHPDAAGVDDGYPLRHLARHLHHAGRSADLHRLLAIAHPVSDGHWANVWFAAHDTASCLVSYLDDIARARAISATATDQAIARSQPASSLGTEVRYALIVGSLASRSSQISAELLGLLVSAGIWSPERGLDHARRLREPTDRCEALMTVHRYVDTETGPVIAGEALAAAAAISDTRARANALFGMAPRLPADQLAEARAVASVIADDSHRAEALARVAAYLPTDQQADALARALAAAAAAPHPYYRAKALHCVATCLPTDQRPDVLAQALATTTAIHHLPSQAGVLIELAPDLPADLLARALDAAEAIPDNYARAEALAGVTPTCPLSNGLTCSTVF